MTMPDAKQHIQVWVLANNAEGAPTLVSYDIECTSAQHDAGDHYAMACARAEEQGYEDPRPFDERDPAGQLMSRLQNLEGLEEQGDIPGDESDPLWRVMVTVDTTMSASVLVRAADDSAAIDLARNFARDNPRVLGVDEISRRIADYYCGDVDAVRREAEEDSDPENDAESAAPAPPGQSG